MRAVLRHAMVVAGLAAGLGGGARAVHAQVAETTGSVRGQLRDQADGAPAAGALITATSTALQGEQTAITDGNGLYFLTALPPGDYTLTINYIDRTTRRDNVLIQVGKQAVVNLTVDSRAAQGELITVRGVAPLIDQGSAKLGVTITREYTDNLPVGRTFGQVIGAAAGAQRDFYGTSLAGATSIENTYIIDGVNTTDTAHGELSLTLPNEFLRETEIITGGYNAEYGRATGGLINVVTKQGANEVHGSVFSYFSPGALSPAARQIEKEGGSIATRSHLDYATDVGAEVGGAIIPDKLWFHVGFDPSYTRNLVTRSVLSQIDVNQDGVPDTDPNTGLALHETVASRDIATSTKTYNFTAKLNGQLNPDHQFQLSAFGNPSTGTQPIYELPYAETWGAHNNVLDRTNGAFDVAGKYIGKFNDGATQIDAIAGFHRSYNRQTAPKGSAGALPLAEYDYTRSLYDFVDVEGPGIAACQDGGPSDKYPLIQNCPVNLYAQQGLALLEQRTNDRVTAALSVTQRVQLLGWHVFKAGLDVEIAKYDTTLEFSGGEELKRSCNTDDTGNCSTADDTSPGAWRVLGYGQIIRYLTKDELANPASVQLGPHQQIDGCAGGLAICGPADARHVKTSDRSIGAYLQDSWTPIPSLTFDLGVRFEQQVLFNADGIQGTPQATGDTIPDVAMSLDNWAPRLGAIFDPTLDGRAKLFGHWGRYYENIPNDINVRAFGGEIVRVYNTNSHQLRPGQPGYDPNCNVDHQAGQNPSGALDACSDSDPSAFLLGSGTTYVAPGTSGQYSDELVLGVEYQVMPDLKLAASYTHRTTPNVIEDVSLDNGNDFLIANPGQNYDAEAAKLLKQAAATNDQALAATLSQRASWLQSLKTFDAPVRNYDAVTLRAEQRPTAKSLVIASYTYARERGNYPGLFSTETNQLDPNASTQYDLPDLMANRYGPLGLDRPHNLKLDGFYLFDLAKLGRLTAGASLRAQSGIAHNVLASHPVYGPGESYLLPRGTVDRSPLTSSLDLHLGYGHALSDKTVLEVFVNVFNVFDAQDETNVDENYTFDNALPIVGGDANDLKHAKAIEYTASGAWHTVNRTLTPNLNYDHTSAVTNPRSFQFGLRLSF